MLATALLGCAMTAGLAAGVGEAGADGVPWPSLRADNLLGETVAYPEALHGQKSLVLVVWTQEQQREANTWLAELPRLERDVPGLVAIEHPVVAPAWRLLKRTVDGWMRSGIPDEAGRARTVTLFVNERSIAASLGIDDRSMISVLLVDPQARIAGRWLGPASEKLLGEVVTVAGGL